MRTGSGGLGVVRVEVRDLVVLEGGGGDGEGRYFVVEGRQVLLDVRHRSNDSCTSRRLLECAGLISDEGKTALTILVFEDHASYVVC